MHLPCAYCISGRPVGCLHPLLILISSEYISLQIIAPSKATWKKLFVFLKESVAIPFADAKDDEAVPEADSTREAAELDTLIKDEL